MSNFRKLAGRLKRIYATGTGMAEPARQTGSLFDKADIYGVAFRPDERELCVWSDKGTIHAFVLADDEAGGAACVRRCALRQMR